MSRRETLKVEAYPAIGREDTLEARILTIQVQKRLRRIVVGAELIGGDQTGRLFEWRLPTPIRPSGLAASFFEAVGFATSVGAEITPTDAIGRRLGVRFGAVGGDVEPVSFTAVQSQEAGHATAE